LYPGTGRRVAQLRKIKENPGLGVLIARKIYRGLTLNRFYAREVNEEMKHSVFTVLLPDKNVEQVFELLRELNYDGVELRIKEDYHVPADKILSRVKELEGLKARYGLEIPVLGTYLSVADREILMPVFEAAGILGSKGVRVSWGPPLDGQRQYWTVHQQAQRQLETLISSVQPFGVKALFEIHFKTLIASPSLAYLLLKEFDAAQVGVIFDPGNMIVEGREDWKVGVEVLGAYLGHVHVKNASWQRDGNWNWRWDELDSGMVDWEEVMGVLFSVNYDGYLSNENLKDAVLPGATGFIGEQLSADSQKPSKPTRTKLAEDLQYLKDLERKVVESQRRTKTE
jgi:sugar phosphate isomerase/epimerase